jgi:uncharacterized damage-inducible protein DinB
MDRDEVLLNPLAHMPPAAVLDGLSPDETARRVPGVSHSIVEILAHMVFWQAWFLDRCSGVATPLPAHAPEGWTPVTAADWDTLRERFLADSRRAVTLPDGPIQPPIEVPPMATYTIDEALIHTAQHNSHHLGQIVTIRQALGLWPPPGGSFTW